MVEKSNIAMYAILGLIGLAAIGLTVYFVFFHNKNKKDEEPQARAPTPVTAPTYNPPSSDTTSGGDASSIDVDILDTMGTDGNNLVLSALSLRRQKKSWTGPIVILEKDYAGGKKQTASFKATADGTKLVNDAGEGLDAWIGARLVTWYDQSGNNRHASSVDWNIILTRTAPSSGKPSYYAFDVGKGRLRLGNNQRTGVFNQISIYSDSNPKMKRTGVAVLTDFGATPVNTVFVFSNGIDSNYKNFLQEVERNPPLKKIRMT